jgi:hypothetical protein
MTLDDIRAMSKPTILASEAAQVLGCDPQWLRLMARERPEKLGFPVCCTSEHRVKIPREPFLRFLGAGGGTAELCFAIAQMQLKNWLLEHEGGY